MFQNSLKTKENPRIAYLLILHGRSIRQINRLFTRIYNKNDYFYIHIDSRSEYLYEEMKYLDKIENIHVTQQRFATIWSGTSLLGMLAINLKFHF